ncbi:MAG: hypothetical protein RQ741_07540 [Wenzhouxiangellaceae bacterium]|nr:hypothetical protein [Wenzhouxiangellaceae bacterium]
MSIETIVSDHTGPKAVAGCFVLCALASLAFGLAAAKPPPLPEPRSNNPVAVLEDDKGALWFTGLGLAPGKTRRDLRADGWIYREGIDEQWQAVPPLPEFEGLAGRLGSHAVVVDGAIYVIGGYTVAEDHVERSTPGVYRLEIAPEPAWTRVSRMPVPVDDSVALVYRDRYVYLVSGWSNSGNVNLVQVWDSRNNTWQQAEPWPGKPVFGHAGGITGNRMAICGGAYVDYPADGPRRFLESDQCWLASIRQDDIGRLDWKPLAPMPGGPRYRAGAVGLTHGGEQRVVFAGGADRPYNYDGQGYDGEAADAFESVVSVDTETGQWHCHEPMPEPGMDYRGLIARADSLVLVGGMDRQRNVDSRIRQWPLSAPHACR